jgi:hypothetical protein
MNDHAMQEHLQGGVSPNEFSPAESPPFLAGGGDLGARMRSFNRRRTPLGPPQDWPRSLKLLPRASLALSMGFHELATNAVKYGALSSDEGRVDIAWSIDEARNGFALDRVVSGGPAVRPPQKRDFGSRLIERGLTQDLVGSVRLEFKPDGIACTIRASLSEVQVVGEKQEDRQER